MSVTLARQLSAHGRTFMKQFDIETQVGHWHRTFMELVQPAGVMTPVG